MMIVLDFGWNVDRKILGAVTNQLQELDSFLVLLVHV